MSSETEYSILTVSHTGATAWRDCSSASMVGEVVSSLLANRRCIHISVFRETPSGRVLHSSWNGKEMISQVLAEPGTVVNGLGCQAVARSNFWDIRFPNSETRWSVPLEKLSPVAVGELLSAVRAHGDDRYQAGIELGRNQLSSDLRKLLQLS